MAGAAQSAISDCSSSLRLSITTGCEAVLCSVPLLYCLESTLVTVYKTGHSPETISHPIFFCLPGHTYHLMLYDAGCGLRENLHQSRDSYVLWPQRLREQLS